MRPPERFGLAELVFLGNVEVEDMSCRQVRFGVRTIGELRKSSTLEKSKGGSQGGDLLEMSHIKLEDPNTQKPG
ncbi:hypothetical protein CDL15_Pgr006461 [Punica granatum]|uniref:Uncharacterized protein n=1 Tax=Punica granatum TaxID=22663 RepID=A0A218XZ98_PUNGR|nr:hypothetical protein CDL15_Pgr006461 [Punica granatum]